MLNLRKPLELNVVKTRRGDDGKADEEYVRLRVAERSETIVVLLSSSIPKSQVDGLAINHHICAVVIEHGGNVLAGKRVGRVRDEKARLTDGTISNNDALDVLHLYLKAYECVIECKSERKKRRVK